MRSFFAISAWFGVFLITVALAVAADVNTPQPQPLGVAATVNGTDITEAQLEAEIAPQLQRVGAQLPPQVVEQFKAQLRQQVLEKIIVEMLLNEKVKANKITVAENEVDAEVAKIAAKEGLSMADFNDLIKAYGKTMDEVKQQIRKGLGYQKLMEMQLAGEVNITDEDAQKYYDKDPNQFKVPEQVRASHILIQPDTSDPNADPNVAKAQAKEKARKLLKQLKSKKGADFAELAKANSACSSAAQGGDLNFFVRGRMVPDFENAAFALKVGQISDIVETQFGYHIIKVTDRKDPNTISFAQAKDGILEKLKQEKQSGLMVQYVESLKNAAKIVYPPGKGPAVDVSPAPPAK